MDYLTGQTIKPYRVTLDGQVLFTDGTNNDLIPSELSCEAYGYTYDQEAGLCRAFRTTSVIDTNFNNITNNIRGGKTALGTNNTILNGSDNETKGANSNCLISGKDNKILYGVKNATVVGVNGKAQRNGEFVIGGGDNQIAYLDAGGSTKYQAVDRQTTIVEMSGVTIDNTPTNLTINGDGSSFINVQPNSIVGYEIYLTRLEVGGTSGTTGNYSYRNMKGVVQIDRSFSMAFIVGFTRNIGKVGVNGSFAMVDTSTADVKSISVQCTDRNNVENVWSAKVYIHETILTSKSF
ncbi:MAG: hypothetical protein GOVbin2390_35 [Prokaryotic dsDNA virus sp.]|nr:MAG: hypothetical protein GOVbin2390_35 [Prokaryotic dsDNA virus sp.]|tara:strand:+ start:4567 stop:5445 length:879 start_codon:yes stop_codon:yes gene_type:complete